MVVCCAPVLLPTCRRGTARVDMSIVLELGMDVGTNKLVGRHYSVIVDDSCCVPSEECTGGGDGYSSFLLEKTYFILRGTSVSHLMGLGMRVMQLMRTVLVYLLIFHFSIAYYYGECDCKLVDRKRSTITFLIHRTFLGPKTQSHVFTLV